MLGVTSPETAHALPAPPPPAPRRGARGRGSLPPRRLGPGGRSGGAGGDHGLVAAGELVLALRARLDMSGS